MPSKNRMEEGRWKGGKSHVMRLCVNQMEKKRIFVNPLEEVFL
jgi:hypothetical protein